MHTAGQNNFASTVDRQGHRGAAHYEHTGMAGKNVVARPDPWFTNWCRSCNWCGRRGRATGARRGLSQTEVAAITGMTQPKVSQVRRYKLQNISLKRLMQALVSLDQRVEIIVRPAHRAHGAGITVAA